MSIENNFDISFIANLALREKQIQQNYRPIIAVHKWFARRPGTLFRGLLLAEFGKGLLKETFYDSNNLSGVRIADPFIGGGTPLIEANRLGCDVTGYDINPMAYWIVRQELEHLNLGTYQKAANKLICSLERQIGHLYRTRCVKCDSPEALAKYFLWVKVQTCPSCGKEYDLFPGYIVAENKRHPKNVILCAACGELNERDNLKDLRHCHACRIPLTAEGPAKRNRCACPSCHTIYPYQDKTAGPPRHRFFAIEYFCPQCKAHHKGRFFKKPDQHDIALCKEATSMLHRIRPRFIPHDDIPPGDETNRLHRWGYRTYQEMFNHRQLLGLELSCRILTKESDERVRNALATNLSDLLRYQNMLCRYDAMALKSLDIFSVHGFPVGLIQCESNLIGTSYKGLPIGSGGWVNILAKYLKAKQYCDHPFEIRHERGRKIQVPIPGEWIGDKQNGGLSHPARRIQLYCQSATEASLPPGSLDGVFTDPPYFANVQYAELMDFCYIWLRRLVGTPQACFQEPSTRNEAELTGNVTLERGLDHFIDGLSKVFQRMASALKPGSPFVFTYHHNVLEAYYPIAIAILDSGMICSASLPSPAEMGASIHIKGTGSSIVDTVFVCRSTGKVPTHWIASSPQEVSDLVLSDIEQLQTGGLTPSPGDIRCMIYGHLIRLAIWGLSPKWESKLHVSIRIKKVEQVINSLGGTEGVEKYLSDKLSSPRKGQRTKQREHQTHRIVNHEISF